MHPSDVEEFHKYLAPEAPAQGTPAMGFIALRHLRKYGFTAEFEQGFAAKVSELTRQGKREELAKFVAALKPNLTAAKLKEYDSHYLAALDEEIAAARQEYADAYDFLASTESNLRHCHVHLERAHRHLSTLAHRPETHRIVWFLRAFETTPDCLTLIRRWLLTRAVKRLHRIS